MTSATNQDAARGGSRRWWVGAALAAAALLLVGAAVWWAVRPAPPPAPPAVSLEGLDPMVAQAIKQAQDRVRGAPRDGRAWGGLGMVLAAHAFRPEAAFCLTEAERLEPREPRWPYYRGVMLQLDGAEADAVPPLRRAVELCPADHDAVRLRLADLLVKQGDLDGAEQHYHALLAQNADHAAARLGLARIDLARDNAAAAADELQHCLDNPAVQQAAYLVLAEVRQHLHEPAAAEAATRKAATLSADAAWPDPFLAELVELKADSQTLVRRAEDLQRGADPAQAEAAMAELEGNHPATPWLLEGRRRLAAGDPAAAEKAFREAVRAEPDFAQVHFWLATALLKRRDAAGAAASFREAVRLQPLHAAAYQGLSQALDMQGDRAGAIDALQKAVRYQPQRAEMHRQLGELLNRDGHGADALVQLRQALDLDPDDAAAKSLVEQIAKHNPPPARP